MVVATQLPRPVRPVDVKAADHQLGLVACLTEGLQRPVVLVVRTLLQAGDLEKALGGLEALLKDAREVAWRLENARNALAAARSTEAAQLRDAQDGR